MYRYPTTAQTMLPNVWQHTRDPRRRAINAYQKTWGFYGFGQADSRYIPTTDQILPSPKAGAWYRIKKGETWWGVAKSAYGADVKKGLLTINKSSWNDHIEKKSTGWEAYNVQGMQATPNYSAANPHAPKGSGSDYPTAWIPPLTGEEPEALYKQDTSVVIVPGSPGESGQKGEKGDPGPAGPGATDAQIYSQLQKWCAENPDKCRGPVGAPGAKGDTGPAGQATPEQIQATVQKMIDANPEKFRGPAGQPGAKGATGPAGQATPEQIQATVQAIIAANPEKFRGPAGLPGAPGIKGDPGPAGQPGSATQTAIAAAVAEYLDSHPIKPATAPTAATTTGKADSKMWLLPLAFSLIASN